MGSSTLKLGLYKPSPHENEYGEKVNSNFDKIDNMVIEAANQTEEDAAFTAGAIFVIRTDLL